MQLFTDDSVVFQGKHIDVIISDNVSEKLDRYRQKKGFAKESGGILLGERRGRYWIITDITTPMEFDIRGRTRFIRQDSKHIEYAKKVKSKSNKLQTYMGEWHTHPQVTPSPSNTDITSWKSIKIDENNLLIFLILGVNGNYACYLTDEKFYKLKCL